jgi:DNA primase
VIDWVMKTEGVSFRHAVEILREGAIPQGPITGKVTKKNTVPKLPTPVSIDAEGRELIHQVVGYYHETLKKSPEGLSYLEKRGLKNSEMIDHFKIGYSNRTLGLRLPEGNRKEGAAIRRKLAELGLYRGTGREHFCGSITFPVFDESGEVTEIYGRKTCHKLTPGLAYHLYLPGPHRGVFNFEALKVSKEIILCEAIIDALTFWCAGFRNVTASYGVNGFTPDHLAAFKNSSVERVFIAYDRDQAGDVASKKLAETLIAEGFECLRVLFPHKMDANDYALKLKPPEKALEVVIRNAIWIGKGNRKTVKVSETQEKEPKAANKGENLSGGIPSPEPTSQLSNPPETASAEPRRLETLSQPSKEARDIFPLAAEKSPEPSPAPAQEPPKPEQPPTQTPEAEGRPPARVPPVSRFCDIPAEVREEEIIINLDGRRWRVRGLAKNMSYDQLKVNLLVSQGERFHVDTFDLYSARCRAVFIKQTSDELRLKEESIKLELGRVLLKLEELQDKQIKALLEPKRLL